MSILKTQLEQWLNSTMVRIIQILLEWCTTWYVLNHSLCFTSNCRVAGNVLLSDCYIFKHVFWLNSADLLDITELIRVLFWFILLSLVGIKGSSEFAEGHDLHSCWIFTWAVLLHVMGTRKTGCGKFHVKREKVHVPGCQENRK